MDQRMDKIELSLQSMVKTEVRKVTKELTHNMDHLSVRVTNLEDERKLLDSDIDEKLNEMREDIDKEFDTLETQMGKVEKSSANENVGRKVKTILMEGCRLKNVNVTQAERKGKAPQGKHPIVVATMESLEQRDLVLASKKQLMNSKHKDIFISRDVELATRVMQNNMRTILKAIGQGDKFTFKGQNLVLNNKDRKEDHHHNSQSQNHNMNSNARGRGKKQDSGHQNQRWQKRGKRN